MLGYKAHAPISETNRSFYPCKIPTFGPFSKHLASKFVLRRIHNKGCDGPFLGPWAYDSDT